MDLPPWDIYAKQQFHHRLGYPLWVPDPAPNMDAIDLGDVGWLEEGEFQPLFYSIERPSRPQPTTDLPTDFVPFDKEHVRIRGPREKLTQPVLCSRSIRRLDVAASASATVSTGYVNSDRDMG